MNLYIISQPTVMSLGCITLGMSMSEALVAATLNAAASLGRGKTHGAIQEGRFADFVIINTNRLVMTLTNLHDVVDSGSRIRSCIIPGKMSPLSVVRNIGPSAFEAVYYSVRKVSDLIFFLSKPGGFQSNTLARGNLEPSYVCLNFSGLSIIPVDGKQHLSEVVFSALVRFSLILGFGFRVISIFKLFLNLMILDLNK